MFKTHLWLSQNVLGCSKLVIKHILNQKENSKKISKFQKIVIFFNFLQSSALSRSEKSAKKMALMASDVPINASYNSS